MRILARLPLTLLPLAMLAACTATAPRYGTHVANTIALREAGLSKAAVGEIRKSRDADGDVDRVKARAVTVASPYGSYTAYVREALASELDHADLLDPQSATRIDGVLLRNELSGNLDTEYALVELELTVTRDGVDAYRATKTQRYEWKSAFLGDVAIPRAIANYQAGVQRVIAAFIADPAFVAALKKR